MEAVVEILKELDWSPLWISLKTGTAATVISFFLGIFAAGKVMHTTPGKKAVLDGILTLPMVIPPTAAGFFCCFCSAGEDRLESFYTSSLISKLYKPGLAVSSRRR